MTTVSKEENIFVGMFTARGEKVLFWNGYGIQGKIHLVG